MKLSIIVPCFNAEKSLAQCLDSLIASTYEPKEIIAVNDGSADGTQRILEEYAREYEFIHIYSKPNEGVSATRNYGISKSTGELITFVDADDFMEPDAYQNMIARLIADDSDVVYCGTKKVFGSRIEEKSFDCKELYTDTTELIKYSMNYKPKFACHSACSGIYKRELLNQMKHLFLPFDIYFSEDTIFNVQYLRLAKRASIVKKSYYNYIQHTSGSLSSSFKESKINAAGRMCRHLMEDELSAEIRQYILINYLVNLSTCFIGLCMDSNRRKIDKLSVIKRAVSSLEVKDLLSKLSPEKLSAKFRVFHKLILLRFYVSIFIMFSINALRRKVKFRG